MMTLAVVRVLVCGMIAKSQMEYTFMGNFNIFFFLPTSSQHLLCMQYHLHVFTSSYFHVDEYDFSHFFKTTLQKNIQEEPTSPPTYAWAYEKCISIGFVNNNIAKKHPRGTNIATNICVGIRKMYFNWNLSTCCKFGSTTCFLVLTDTVNWKQGFFFRLGSTTFIAFGKMFDVDHFGV